MKKFRYIFVLLLPMLSFASGNGESDIMWRTVNFLIFAGLLYYILAGRIKSFLVDRKNQIAKKLDSIQQKLKESKDKKNAAIAKIDEAKANANAYKISSEKETQILISKINADIEQVIINIEKSQNEQMSIEKRKMIRQVINDVLDELFDSNTTTIDKKAFVDIVMKKVA